MSATKPGSDPTGRTARQIRRFLILGVVCLVVDFSVYHSLARWSGIRIAAAKAISYGCAIVLAFVGNKYWTFQSPRRGFKEPARAMLVYLVTFAVNVLLNYGLFAAFAEVMNRDGSRHVAFLATTLVTTVLNYLGMRFIAFGEGLRASE